MDLALKNLRRFICHKTPTNQPLYLFYISISIYLFSQIFCLSTFPYFYHIYVYIYIYIYMYCIYIYIERERDDTSSNLISVVVVSLMLRILGRTILQVSCNIRVFFLPNWLSYQSWRAHFSPFFTNSWKNSYSSQLSNANSLVQGLNFNRYAHFLRW